MKAFETQRLFVHRPRLIRNVFFSPIFVYRLGLLFCLLVASAQHTFADITLTDIAGRKVELGAPAKRILLDGPAHYSAMALISKSADDLIVGVSNAPNGRDAGPVSETIQDLAGKPRIGSIWARTFSIEKALELKPDLLIAGLGSRGQATAIESALAKAGVPVIYIDFSLDPSKNTAASLEIIGKAIGEERRAAEFIDFYQNHVGRVTDRLKSVDLPRPKLLVMSRGPGVRCCLAAPDSGVTAYFGGHGVENIAGARKFGQSSGPVQLSLEYIIASDPDIFVINAIGKGPESFFGEPPTSRQGIASLEKLRSEPGFRELSATRNGRLHVVDLSISNSPLILLQLEAIAKWLHPELFADIDPQETLHEINRRFLKTPLKGPFWVSLDRASDQGLGPLP